MIANILVVSSKAYTEEVRKQYREMDMNFYIVDNEYLALSHLARFACQVVILHMDKSAEQNFKLLALMRCIVNVNVLVVLDQGYQHADYLEYATAVYVYPHDDLRLQQDLRSMLEERAMIGNERVDFYHCRGLVFIPCYHKVFYGREEIKLTPREFALLNLLVENRHTVLHKEQILQTVWEDDIELAGEQTLKTHIKRLRSKIGAVSGKEFIETVYKFGYRFMEYPAPEQLCFTERSLTHSLPS